MCIVLAESLFLVHGFIFASIQSCTVALLGKVMRRIRCMLFFLRSFVNQRHILSVLGVMKIEITPFCPYILGLVQLVCCQSNVSLFQQDTRSLRWFQHTVGWCDPRGSCSGSSEKYSLHRLRTLHVLSRIVGVSHLTTSQVSDLSPIGMPSCCCFPSDCLYFIVLLS